MLFLLTKTYFTEHVLRTENVDLGYISVIEHSLAKISKWKMQNLNSGGA